MTCPGPIPKNKSVQSLSFREALFYCKGGVVLLIAKIVCLNSQYVHSSLAPWCLLAGVKQYAPGQVSAAVIEGSVNEPPQQLLARLCQAPWQVMGFCCYVWNISLVKWLCRELSRLYPDRVIVLGGPEVGFCPKRALEQIPGASYVITGPGELAFARLCLALSSQEEPERVPGVSSRRGSTPPQPLPDPPSPYTREYFESLGGRMAYIETMRGCPFSCAFCVSGRRESLVTFPLERVKQELMALAASGTRTVKVIDRSFNVQEERAIAIVEFLIHQHRRGTFPPDLQFHFEIEAMSLSPRLMEAFFAAPAGLFRLEVGIQSFHPATLEAVGRKSDVPELYRRLQKLCSCPELTVHADLIAGLPLEGMAQFGKSFDRAFSLAPRELQLGILKGLGGTPMGDHPEEYGCVFSPDPPYRVLSTQWLSSEELGLLEACAHAVERLYNSGRFALTLPYAIGLFSSPFAFFCAVALPMEALEVPSPDAICDLLLEILPRQGGDPVHLRDLLIQDRLATGADRLTPGLRRLERGVLHPKKRLAAMGYGPCGRRGAAFLQEKAQLVFCDYQTGPYCQKDPVTGRYRLFYLPVEE